MAKFEVAVGPHGVEVIDTLTGRREIIRGAGSIGASRLRASVPDSQEVPSLKFTAMVAS